jgi:hypothetical protein
VALHSNGTANNVNRFFPDSSSFVGILNISCIFPTEWVVFHSYKQKKPMTCHQLFTGKHYSDESDLS